MKSRTLISILILVLAVLIVIGSCATGKKAVKAPIEPFYGTWANSDYNTVGANARKIFRPDGTYTDYSHTGTEIPEVESTYTIIKSWMDSDGKKYYKVETFFEKYSLYRLDETDSVLEYVWSNIDYPSEIDPNHYNYRIYYRQ